MSRVLFIDTEVSSLETKEVVQLAWAEGIDGEIQYAMFQPSGEWDVSAIAVHHILPCDVEGLQPSANAKSVLPPCDYVVGHNVDFDADVLGGMPCVKRICTLALARKKWPNLSSHKLTTLAYHVMGLNLPTRKLLRGAHDASVDVHICREVLKAIVGPPEAPIISWPEIYKASEAARVPEVMTFGKWKGTRIAEVPQDYKRWLLGQSDVDPYLRKALQS